MTSFLGAPVSSRGRAYGNLYLTNKLGAGEFDPEDEEALVILATQAGIAVENARLYEEVERLTVLEDRERIARDLHDGVIQALFAVGMGLQGTAMRSADEELSTRIEGAVAELDRVIRDLRNYIFGLRPELVDQTDLTGLLGALADQLRQNSLIDVELRLPESSIDLPAHARAELLQIAREALSNVARHSEGTWAELAISEAGEEIVLAIADNGRGFEPTTVKTGEHYGLANMRDRAVALGGTLQLESAVGAGTRIIVRIPALGYSTAET
jgi:signal transduction histidine kinase